MKFKNRPQFLKSFLFIKIILLLLANFIPSANADDSILYLYTENSGRLNYSLQGREFEHKPQYIGGSSTVFVKKLLDKADVPYRMKLRKWTVSFDRAQNRPNYGVFSTPMTDEYKDKFEWIGPINQYKWVLMTKPDSGLNISSLSDLKDLRVGGYKGSSVTKFLQSQGFKVDALPTDTLNPRRLHEDMIDVWATTSDSAYEIAENSGYAGVEPLMNLKTVDLYLAINKGTPKPVLDRLRNAYEELKSQDDIGFSKSQVVVGSKGFTEQHILAELSYQLLKSKSIKVAKLPGMSSSLIRKAQVNGEVDIYWEYTGTSLVSYNKVFSKMTAQDGYKKVQEMDAQIGLTWLNPSSANNTYALAFLKTGRLSQINTISDLAKVAASGTELKVAATAEFVGRDDGLRGLLSTYGFNIERANIKVVEPDMAYESLRDGAVDIALVFATDGRISNYGFTILKDNLSYFPDYTVAPVVRTPVLSAHGEIADLLNRLAQNISETNMRQMNALVDIQGQAIEDVARDFLVSHNLL